MPPSKTPVTSLGAGRVSLPLLAGMGSEARFSTLEKFIGNDFDGPAETVMARARTEESTEAFILVVGVVDR